MTKPRRVEMVYAGAAHHRGETVYAYYPIADGTLGDRAVIYSTKLSEHPVGAVCSYTAQPSGAVNAPSGIFTRHWPVIKMVQEWQVRNDAVLATQVAWESRELSQAFDCLAPLRSAYGRLSEQERGVLIAQMVRYVVTPHE